MWLEALSRGASTPGAGGPKHPRLCSSSQSRPTAFHHPVFCLFSARRLFPGSLAAVEAPPVLTHDTLQTRAPGRNGQELLRSRRSPQDEDAALEQLAAGAEMLMAAMGERRPQQRSAAAAPAEDTHLSWQRSGGKRMLDKTKACSQKNDFPTTAV